MHSECKISRKGNKTAAIGTTGVELTPHQRHLADKIKRKYLSGEALNISAVRRSDPTLLEEVFSVKPFWGWKSALHAAGLEYGQIKIMLSDTIPCLICGKEHIQLAHHLKVVHGVTTTKYRADFPCAQLTSETSCALRFGRTTKKGSVAVTSIIPHWEPLWTPEYVLDRLAEIARVGAPLDPATVSAKESTLWRNASQYYGSWDAALAAAGIHPSASRRKASKSIWTGKSVILALKARRQAGQPCNWTAIQSNNRALSSAMLKYFGTCDDALQAAGMNPAKIRKSLPPRVPYKTEADVIAAIRLRRAKKLHLYGIEVQRGLTKDCALYMKARRLFGGWHQAVVAAGIEWSTANHKPIHFPTKLSVSKAIKKRHKTGLNLGSQVVRHTAENGQSLYAAGLKFFGRWEAAVNAAGIDYHPSP